MKYCPWVWARILFLSSEVVLIQVFIVLADPKCFIFKGRSVLVALQLYLIHRTQVCSTGRHVALYGSMFTIQLSGPVLSWPCRIISWPVLSAIPYTCQKRQARVRTRERGVVNVTGLFPGMWHGCYSLQQQARLCLAWVIAQAVNYKERDSVLSFVV